MPAHRPGRPGSIRGEASRRGVSEYQIRLERALEVTRGDRAYATRLARGRARQGELRMSDRQTFDRLRRALDQEKIQRTSPELHRKLAQIAEDTGMSIQDIDREFFSP